MSKQRNIGTAAETAVVRYAAVNGFALAERLALKGNADHGDVRLVPGLHVEVKGGKAAEKAGPGMIADWMDECDTEAANSGSLVFLVRKRAACGVAQVGRWHAHFRLGGIPLPPLSGWAHRSLDPQPARVVVSMDLADALVVLRSAGWGDPL
jgi:hypothetical protein